MQTSTSANTQGLLSSLIAGSLLIIGHTINLLQGGTHHMTQNGQVIIFFAHLILIIALFLLTCQAPKSAKSPGIWQRKWR